MFKEPPHNQNAEKAILGALLTDSNNQSCRQTLDMMDSSAFYLQSNRVIFDTIKRMSQDDLHIDTITVTEKLKADGNENISGGYFYISELPRAVTSLALTTVHVNLVNKIATTREIITTAQQAIEHSESLDPNELIEMIENNLRAITSKDTGKEVSHISEFGENWADKLDERVNSGGAISGLETGISQLDERLSGFDLEGLIVLAGRPSMGKTLMAQTIMDFVGGKAQKNCLFFSMEMSDKQVYERFISKASGVCPKKIRSGKGLDDQDWGRLTTGMGHVNSSKIFVDTDAKLSVAQIRARVRRHASKNGNIGLIVIDYLGLMAMPKAASLTISIGEVTSALKSLAKEMKTPILLLVQGSRAMDKGGRPVMSDLKDSSSIEADADVVLFVHRQEVLDPDTELKGVTELIIAKDRHNDGNGTIHLTKCSGGFMEISEQEVAEMVHREETKNQPPQRGYARR